MNVTQVSASPGGALENAAGERVVLTPVGEAPLRVFRRMLFFQLPTGGLAEQLVIDSAVLEARFQPFDYEAIGTPQTFLRARVTALDGVTLRVELDTPRRVRQVRLSPSRVPGTGFTLELYRLDGEAVAGNPTVTASNALPQVQFIGGAGLNGVAIAAGPVGGVFDQTGFGVDFTDVRFALRLKNPAGNAVALAPRDLSEVRIRSLPSGPRLGIAAPEEPDAAAVFFQAPGEIGGATPVAAGEVDAGSLAETLRRHLASITETPLPATIDVALVIESDAPCVLDVMAFNVAFRLRRESFFQSLEKQVLRFAGPARRQLTIPVPTGVAVLAATVRATPSFRRERPAGDASGGLAQDRGVFVEPERWIAQPIRPPQALAVSGVGLGLTALADGTRLRVELQEDRQGRPSGGTLAGGEVEIEQAAERAWVTARFAAPVVLPAQPHWLLVTGADGRAVWLADAGAGSVRLLTRMRSTLPWEEQSALAGLQPVYRLLSGGAEALDKPPFALRLGELEATPTADDAELYDLTAALNAFLATSTADVGLIDVPLIFDAAVPGILTVYPPRVEYT